MCSLSAIQYFGKKIECEIYSFWMDLQIECKNTYSSFFFLLDISLDFSIVAIYFRTVYFRLKEMIWICAYYLELFGAMSAIIFTVSLIGDREKMSYGF